MSSPEEMMEKLRADVERLSVEKARLADDLEKANDANVEAARYGLQIVDEKIQLEQKLRELQASYEAAKIEIEATKESLKTMRSQHREAARTEAETEDKLLEESASREADYLHKISTLEAELRSTSQELQRTKADLDRCMEELKNHKESFESLDEHKKNMQKEIKDLKSREQRLINEYSELEEENVNLQTQVSGLRNRQVEFEAMKMEVKRLVEETELLQANMDDANALNSTVSKQLEEALQLYQQEREHRLALKKELDQARNAEHMNQLNNMLADMTMGGGNSEADSQALKTLESSFHGGASQDSFPAPLPGAGGDLFSEIHGDMSNKVNELERERDELSLKLKDVQRTAVQGVSPLLRKLEVSVGPDTEFGQLKELLNSGLTKIDDLLQGTAPNRANEKLIEQIRGDLHTAVMIAAEKNAKLASAQDVLLTLSDSVNQFYHQLVGNQSLDSDRSVAEIMSRLKSYAKCNVDPEAANLSTSASSSQLGANGEETTESGTDAERDTRSPRLPLNLSRAVLSERFRNELSSRLSGDVNFDSLFTDSDLRERVVFEEDDVFKVADSLSDLLRIVKRTAEIAVNSKMHMDDAEQQELYVQNMKLRSQLGTKRDQIATLRTVLKSNKITAESALASLRDKYETEKAMSHDITDRLRKELKAFKEDAATFASHRAMFTARCEELQAQVEEYHAREKSAEEEKKTLNSLLRMAIAQKLTLTQRLEDLEVDRERQTFKRGGHKASGRGGDNNLKARLLTVILVEVYGRLISVLRVCYIDSYQRFLSTSSLPVDVTT
ncbi:hypothetical protein QR680_002979 [Steinernema hermaphroditum]|uniref:Protein bicaudal D n=1 Tax=Steinernema hermaphroditum TaxID=289476 RepID=A0AA39H6S9_9BILA|nr:hypothetical protein QR680_002979 [Steinernema hermaphroditum]